MVERRNHERLSIAGEVFLSEYTIPFINKEAVSELVNISEEGALIRTEQYFEPGSLLKLRIMIDGWDRYLPMTYRLDRTDFKEPLISIAEVLRIEMVSEGFYMLALKFDAIDLLHKKSLGSFINSNLI